MHPCACADQQKFVGTFLAEALLTTPVSQPPCRWLPLHPRRNQPNQVLTSRGAQAAPPRPAVAASPTWPQPSPAIYHNHSVYAASTRAAITPRSSPRPPAWTVPKAPPPSGGWQATPTRVRVAYSTPAAAPPPSAYQHYGASPVKYPRPADASGLGTLLPRSPEVQDARAGTYELMQANAVNEIKQIFGAARVSSRASG